MLGASPEISALQKCFARIDHTQCHDCQRSKWTPTAGARCGLHRHQVVTTRVNQLMGGELAEFCRPFPTNCDGQNLLFSVGLSVFEPLQLMAQAHGISFFSLLQKAGPTRLLQSARQAIAEEALRALSEPAPNEAKEEATPQEESQPDLWQATPQEESQPDLWQAIVPALIEHVGEKNFETWLSCVRFLSAYDQVIVLGCSNKFFKDYLTEHYREVIKEELRKTGERRSVIFQVVEAPPEPVKEEAAEILTQEKLPSPLLQKVAKRQADRKELEARCCAHLNGKLQLVVFKYLDELKLLLAKEAEEDRLESERDRAARKEAWKGQKARGSFWWADDRASPKKMRQLAQQIDRDDQKGAQKLNSS